MAPILQRRRRYTPAPGDVAFSRNIQTGATFDAMQPRSMRQQLPNAPAMRAGLPGLTPQPFEPLTQYQGAAGPALSEPPVSPATAAETAGIQEPGNTQQRWETPTDRYYTRKHARNMQAQSRNPAAQDYYRMKQRITPGAGNIPGYGTPARPPRGLTSGGLSTGADRGYAQVAFNNSPSGWQPY